MTQSKGSFRPSASIPIPPSSGGAASAHTAGPWEAVKDGDLLLDDWLIRTSHPDPEMRDVMELWNASEADARLAAASPTLLHAVIAALPYLETAESDPAYKPGAVAAVTKQLRAAIQSATGVVGSMPEPGNGDRAAASATATGEG